MIYKYYGSFLKSVTIGSGVLNIGSQAFGYDSNDGSRPVKVIWLTNTPPSGYANAGGTVNYVANDLYTSLSNKTVYPYLSSYFDVEGIRYVPVSPSERTCDAIDCMYDNSAEHINIGMVSYRGVTMTVKDVKPYVFYLNTYIKDVQVNSSGRLGNKAFYGCTNMNTLEIGGNVTSIGDYTFDRCSSLKNVIMEDGKESMLVLGSNGSSPMFASCPLDSVYVGRNISFPTNSATGYSPFYRNTSLRSIHFTDNETEISEYEFYGCTNLKNARIGNGVTTIGKWAFSGCSNLDFFACGSSVKTIGQEAFSDCTAMTKLYSFAPVPPTCGSQALDDINKWNCTLYVPEKNISAYQAAPQWKDFFFMEKVDGVSAIDKPQLIIDDILDLNGRQLTRMQKGINIVRMSDGTVKLIMVK